MPSIVIPQYSHKRQSVRTYYILTRISKTLFTKARKQLKFKTMKVNPSRFKPFMLITREDNKVVIVAGNTQMSPIEFDDEEQAESYLRTQPYEMMTNMYTIFRFYEQHPEELQKQLKNENNESEQTK